MEKIQTSVSHDSLEIILMCWFDAQETSYYCQIFKCVLLNIFVETTFFEY